LKKKKLKEQLAVLSLHLESADMDETDLAARINNLDTFMTDRVVDLEQIVKRHDREILLLIGAIVLFELFNSVSMMVIRETDK
jgi:hypothetical protein